MPWLPVHCTPRPRTIVTAQVSASASAAARRASGRALSHQRFQQLLSIQSVKRIIQDSYGYQPFFVAPENGYRALVKEGVMLMEQPSASTVDAVDMVLRDVGQKVCGRALSHQRRGPSGRARARITAQVGCQS